MEWNLRHGGSKARHGPIMESIRFHNPNILVLTEYQDKEYFIDNMKRSISSDLLGLGYIYQHPSTFSRPSANGVLIASKLAFHKLKNADRLAEIILDQGSISLLGVHIPGFKDKSGCKADFWKTVIDYANEKRSKNVPAILMGDFNTGLAADAEGAMFKGWENMESLKQEDIGSPGFIDAYEHYFRDIARCDSGKDRFTWYSPVGNGFRLDYVFLSPDLKDNLKMACHSHVERGVCSDHSPLIIQMDI
jgi:exonuclease III